MKKYLVYFLILSLIICAFSGCQNRSEVAFEDTYQKFMANEITAHDKNGVKKSIDKYILNGSLDGEYKYTYIEMTGDGVLELCVKQFPEMYFFTIKNGEVYHWYTESKADSKLLNNGAFLYERHGAAPTHINYEYYELDENANVKFSTTFSWWDGKTIEVGKIYPDTYIINGKEVFKEEYERKTQQYLSIGNDEIFWRDKENKTVNSGDNEVQETLSERLVREIDSTYREEQKSPEDGSTIGMVELSNKYAQKWKQVADEYYDKIMKYDGITQLDENYYSSDDLHTFVSNMKKSWESYNKEQCDNYGKTLSAIYGGGTIIGPLLADFEYNMQKDWALRLVNIYEKL